MASNKEFWQKKLTRNVERDQEVTDELTEQGWLVLRFWENDVKTNISAVIEEIQQYL